MRYLKKFEGILQPYRLEEREELLKVEILRKLSREVIEGDLVINHPHFLEVESRVKKVRGNVSVELDKIPDWLECVEVFGRFDISWGKSLTSLKGSPKWVGGDFLCANNKLGNLIGSPLYVGGNFYCSNNKLISLEGAPPMVGGNFTCSYNKVEFTKVDVERVSNVLGEIYI